ncbi:Golgi transport complex subunit 1 [Apophysomyces ossiformis]|uniref:Conserved oligomeric Golgi complex subunit 1 n=1 Tax=Apophysomyces ossiformis TaxID=679940 RepID=A0A8H7EQE9_9FUNG|nr:Golgi transport complex subunit 1 [Apophysomyces ossiformis]
MARRGSAQILEHPPSDDDPDNILAHVSVAEARALEKQTREQYLDLISAADAIITMSKNAQKVHQKLETMQTSCNASAIQQRANSQNDSTSLNEEPNGDRKQRQLYVLATLIKAIADIWYALENHQYLQAGRLYRLASVVKEQLELESEASFIDIDVAFPVIQRQWDAVSSFMPQIIQKSIFHLRVAEQDSKSVAEILTGLMLSDEKNFEGALEILLEMRLSAIKDLVIASVSGTQNKLQDQRVTHQLRETIQIINRTLIHVYQIFTPKNDASLIETYVEELQKNFMMPAHSHHGYQPAITRVFLPSTNVHLLMRYLPESVQRFTPKVDSDRPLTRSHVRSKVKAWISQIYKLMDHHLSSMLRHVHTHQQLIDIRSRIWSLLSTYETESQPWQQACSTLLDEEYSLWTTMLREPFNDCAKHIIDIGCVKLSEQPRTVIWKLIIDDPSSVTNSQLNPVIWPDSKSQRTTFQLPNLSSSTDIAAFKKALADSAQGQTSYICELQMAFETSLKEIRMGVENHRSFSDVDKFHAKTDTAMILAYFQEKCFDAILIYVAGLKEILKDLTEWQDRKLANDVSIFVGRLARVIALLSRELPDMLTRAEGISLGSKYNKLQHDMTTIFRISHDGWMDLVASEFGRKLSSTLARTRWNDQCPATFIWEAVDDKRDTIHLPTQATNAIVRIIFEVCDEIRRLASNLLDKNIIQSLRQHMWQAATEAWMQFLGSDTIDITEKGAIQMIFDVRFMALALESADENTIIDQLKQWIDQTRWAIFEPYIGPTAHKFYLKQTLILGVLTRAGGQAFEKARKTISAHQNHNVLPVAEQGPRFTLLPIGHLTSSCARRTLYALIISYVDVTMELYMAPVKTLPMLPKAKLRLSFE